MLIYFILGSFFLNSVNVVQSQESSRITNIKCSSLVDYIINLTCGIKAVSRNTYEINASGLITKPLSNLYLRIKVYKKSNGYQPFIIDYEQDVCSFLQNPIIKYPALKFIPELLKTYSNLNHTCPLEGNFFVKDLQVNFSALPAILPSGNYRFDHDLKMKIKKKMKLVAFGSVYAHFVKNDWL